MGEIDRNRLSSVTSACGCRHQEGAWRAVQKEHCTPKTEGATAGTVLTGHHPKKNEC